MDNIRPIDANKFEVIGGIVPYGCDADSYLRGCKEILDMIDNAPTLEYPKWISVKERLPELNEKILVCVERPMFSIKTYFTVDTAFYIGNGVWQYKFEKRPHVTYGPKYWMPLPEPPKE